MEQFNTTKEELQKLGQEFKSQAFNLIDDLFNLAYWLVLKKRSAKKIVWITFKKAIYYCDKTKTDTDWGTWMHRIFLNRIFDYYNGDKKTDTFEFELIDRWSTGSNLISRITENNPNQISEKKILELLGKFPKNLIRPLILKDIYNLSYKSIAEYLDVSDVEVECRIYRSRKYFFKILAEEKLSEDLLAKNNFASDSIFTIQQLRKTALMLDDELTQSERSTFRENLDKELYLRTEFEIQELVKRFLNKSISRRNAPISLKRMIKKEAEKRFYVTI